MGKNVKFLEKKLVALDVTVKDPEEAIKKAGELLVQADLVENTYVEAMLRSYRENGPYFVIAPHIAIPHARPEDGVCEACVSLIQLKHGIHFGHQANDPVKLVFGLGASSSEEHLTLLKKLMNLLNKQENIKKLFHAKSYEDINHLIKEV